MLPASLQQALSRCPEVRWRSSGALGATELYERGDKTVALGLAEIDDLVGQTEWLTICQAPLRYSTDTQTTYVAEMSVVTSI